MNIETYLVYDRIPLLKEVKPHKNGKSNDGDSKRYLLENGVGSDHIIEIAMYIEYI